MKLSESGFLEKKLTSNGIYTINESDGKVEVRLSQFEINGLKTGKNMSFKAWIKSERTTSEVIFDQALCVVENNGKKNIGGVDETMLQNI